MKKAKDYGLCPYCKSGNANNGIGCTWGDENPHAVKCGIDRPCYCDIVSERDRYAEMIKGWCIMTAVLGILAACLLVWMMA